MNRELVIKITGKLFSDDKELLKKYIDVFKELLKEYRLIIVCGGGKLAREYIHKARSLSVNSNYWLDTIGIIASRLNSYLLISSLQPYTYPEPVKTLEELLKIRNNYKVIVLGGLIPGQSTASVALEVAEALGVDKIIDFSAVDKVYDKDPRKYSDAKPLEKIKIEELKKILKQQQLPGEYALIDVRALDIAERSNITIYITYYKNPENIFKVLNGENPGTIIYP